MTGGASFCMQLPALAPAPASEAEAGSGPEAEARTARILVVDDEPSIAEMVRAMLEAAGHEVATAETGQVALALLAEVPFVLHGWLRSGNTGAARGVVAFLCEALALLPEMA